MKTIFLVAAMLLTSVNAASDPQSALDCQVRNKMTPLVFLGLLLSTCDASISASNNGPELQAFANSTNAVNVARREIACTPTGTKYLCYNRCYTHNKCYTQVPNTVWIATTTVIFLQNNAITFIPANAFDGLTLMTDLSLYDNRITSVPVGMLDTNIALKKLYLHFNAITSVPVGMVDNNPALDQLELSDNPLSCLDFTGNSLNWVFGTAISSICTSCYPNPMPQTVTCGSLQIDFWQCDSQCVSEPNSESPTVSPASPTVSFSPTVSPSTEITEALEAAAAVWITYVIVVSVVVVICCCIIPILACFCMGAGSRNNANSQEVNFGGDFADDDGGYNQDAIVSEQPKGQPKGQLKAGDPGTSGHIMANMFEYSFKARMVGTGLIAQPTTDSGYRPTGMGMFCCNTCPCPCTGKVAENAY